MKAAILRVGVLALAGAVCLACAAAAEPYVSVRVTGLAGTATSVMLPIDGQQVSTGEIAITAGRTTPVEGVTYWDLASADRPIQWPATIQCGFFTSQGVASRTVTLYGIVRPLEDGSLGDLDVGVLDVTDSGDRVIVININTLRTDASALSLLGGPNAGLTAAQSEAEVRISGTFGPLAQARGGIRAWPELLRDLETVVASVPGLFDLPPDFAQRAFSFYESTGAASELAFYFPKTDTFQASTLRGDFVIEVSPWYWHSVLPSFEDLLRLQAQRLESFEDLLKHSWETLSWTQKMQFLKSFEDLLRSQADRLSSFESLLHALPHSVPGVRYLDSFEDLLRRQARLLESFEYLTNTLAFPRTTQ
jgi:hypothetical protein